MKRETDAMSLVSSPVGAAAVSAAFEMVKSVRGADEADPRLIADSVAALAAHMLHSLDGFCHEDRQSLFKTVKDLMRNIQSGPI